MFLAVGWQIDTGKKIVLSIINPASLSLPIPEAVIRLFRSRMVDAKALVAPRVPIFVAVPVPTHDQALFASDV